MKPGPSLFKWSALGCATALASAVLAGGGPPSGAQSASNAAPPPAHSVLHPSLPTASATRASVCPRCGYRGHPGWRYCAACGWDLDTLVGEDAQRHLEAVSKAVVGLVVIKVNPRLHEVVPPKYARWLKRYGSDRGEPGRRRYFGTAFPFGGSGLYVTKARLLERAVEARLRTYDNRQIEAEIIAYDLPSGIGLVKALVHGTPPLENADRPAATSDGSWAVCYPIAREKHLVRYLPQSLHRGRVTATGQIGTGLASFENLLRSDHSVPAGCGGAPLIDLRGGLIGMILGSPDPGLTYAVPIGNLAPIVGSLVEEGRVERPFFGIGLVSPDSRRRARFGLDDTTSLPLVAYLVPGSPAERAGVRPGDFLMEVNGEEVGTVAAAGARLLKGTTADSRVALTVLRRGQEVKIDVSPEERPEQILLDPVDEIQESLEANFTEVTTGPTSKHGLRVSELVRGGRGEQQGFRDGDVIVRVNSKPVRHLDTFSTIVRSKNEQVFGGKRGAGTSPVSIYALWLEVRTQGGEKETRYYENLFPFFLSPPVY